MLFFVEKRSYLAAPIKLGLDGFHPDTVIAQRHLSADLKRLANIAKSIKSDRINKLWQTLANDLVK